MKQHKTKGEILHEQLTECLASNSKGLPYSQCNRVCSEANYWVLDKGNNECFSLQKSKRECPFEVKSSDNKGNPKRSWLVCVDEGLITNQKSNSMPRCDNLLFNDEIFYFVEAKMRVSASRETEIKDAIENKIPKTKAFLGDAMGEFDVSFPPKIGIAIPFPYDKSKDNRKPNKIKQKQEQLLLEARSKLGKSVFKVTLSETIIL